MNMEEEEFSPYGGFGSGCDIHGEDYLRECTMCGIEFCSACFPNSTLCPDCAAQGDLDGDLEEVSPSDEEKELLLIEGFEEESETTESAPAHGPAPAPKPIAKPAAKLAPNPAPQAKTQAKAKVKAKPKAKVKAKPKAKVKARPKAKVKARPKAKVKAKPKVKVKARKKR